MDWHGLFGNFAVIAFAVILWTMVHDAVTSALRPWRAPFLGVVMGSGAVLAMLLSVPLAPGVFIDLRAAPVSLAGLFGGPVAASIAGAMAILFRLFEGGAGMWSGALGLAIAASIGVIGHSVGKRLSLRYWHLALFSAVVGLGSLLSLLVLPRTILDAILTTVALPASVLTILGTLGGGVVLLHDRRRRYQTKVNGVYRAVMEALPDSLNAKDSAGRFIIANPATARLMRSGSADRLIGRTDFDFYPNETAQRFRADEQAAMQTEPSSPIEQETTFADGSIVWLETMKTPLRDEAGQVRGVITHNRDITDRKRLRDHLSQTQRRLDNALAHMADALVLFDGDGVLRLRNEQYLELFPLTADVRIVGARIEEILSASVARGEQRPVDGPIEDWIEAIRALHFMPGERTVEFGNGRHIEIRTRILEDGSSLQVLSDVTERIRRDVAIAASEARYRLLAENAADLIVRIGADGRCRFASPASVPLLGYEQEHMLGRHALGIVHVPDRPRAAIAFEGVMSGHTVNGLEVRVVRHGGTLIWVDISARPVEREGGFVLSMRDITTRKTAEDDLAAAMCRLEELATKDGLTGLATRRVFDETLDREFARCVREGLPLALFLVDVDRFKAYNDTYGHPMGDECLRRVGDALRLTLRRPADVAARYGGEELVAILPNTDSAGARTIAERFRQTVRDLGIVHAGSEHGMVTVSIGVAATRPAAGGRTAADLLRHADEALYRAKGCGRDKVRASRAA